jgi:hypothetical protein
MGPACQRGERGEKSTGSGLRGSGPWADSEAGPDGFPGALFIYFSSFFSFLFLFSEFFQIFCKNTSIQIKLLPEILNRLHIILSQ